VGKDYEVLVSKRVQVEKNLPGHILTLSDRSIFTPDYRDAPKIISFYFPVWITGIGGES
jgi:hypothetical protein